MPANILAVNPENCCAFALLCAQIVLSPMSMPYERGTGRAREEELIHAACSSSSCQVTDLVCTTSSGKSLILTGFSRLSESTISTANVEIALISSKPFLFLFYRRIIVLHDYASLLLFCLVMDFFVNKTVHCCHY